MGMHSTVMEQLQHTILSQWKRGIIPCLSEALGLMLNPEDPIKKLFYVLEALVTSRFSVM